MLTFTAGVIDVCHCRRLLGDLGPQPSKQGAATLENGLVPDLVPVHERIKYVPQRSSMASGTSGRY